MRAVFCVVFCNKIDDVYWLQIMVFGEYWNTDLQENVSVGKYSEMNRNFYKKIFLIFRKLQFFAHIVSTMGFHFKKKWFA